MSAAPAHTPPTTGTTIAIDGITKSFPGIGGGTTTAVDRVSLKIESGELFFLLGPSGCGKTTLLRMIAGFIDPTAGRLLFLENGGERDVTYLPPNKRNTGMVFQSYALWPHMTVAENVAFGLDVRKVRGEDRTRRVMEALSAVRMQEYAQRKPNQLSGGQQQRVALARALVIRPSVLLLDEPLSNLDAKLRIELRSEIRRICKEAGTTTVYVTHDQKEALSMADRVAIMKLGVVQQIGTPEALYRQPASRFVAEFLGETNLIAAKVTRITESGVSLETAAGPLTARTPLPPNTDADVLISIRPEALSPAQAPGPNTLAARVRETTYLGEVAQHDLELLGALAVKMAVLNPGSARASLSHVRVAPEDVVIIPA
jgi:iron(III) transport system ATP-binding protein